MEIIRKHRAPGARVLHRRTGSDGSDRARLGTRVALAVAALAFALVVSGCVEGGDASSAASTQGAEPSATARQTATPSPFPVPPASPPPLPPIAVETVGDLLVLVQVEGDGNAMGHLVALEREGSCLVLVLDGGERHHAVLRGLDRIADGGLVTRDGDVVPFGEQTTVGRFGTRDASTLPASYLETCGSDLPLFGVGT